MKKFTVVSSFIKALILSPSILFTSHVFAQSNPIMVVKGGPFIVDVGGLVQVNGTFQNENPTYPPGTVVVDSVAMQVLGTLNVEGDFINNYESGRFNFPNNGDIYVRGNWVNNDTFWPGTGGVYLNGLVSSPSGGLQLLTGTLPTTFNNLSLSLDPGLGIKKLTLDQYVGGKLSLNNSELATDLFTMNVINPITLFGIEDDMGQIGFVSTASNTDNSQYGRLVRATSDISTYDFPMGSRSGSNPVVYRKVRVKPVDINANKYAVSFFNESPNNYGYLASLFDDTSICSVNPNYFFNITREAGTSNADITLTYDPLTDGTLSGVVNWATAPAPTEWKNLGGPFPLSNVDNNGIYNLKGVTKVQNYDFNTLHRHFNLGLVRPPVPVISGPTSYCGDFDAQYSFTPYDNNTTWDWDAQMGNVIGDTTVNPATIVWEDTTASFEPTQGVVKLTQSIFGCNSLEGTYNISILSNPIANFNITSANNYNSGLVDTSISNVYTFDLLHYNNTSTNTQSWFWNFGDSDTSILESPFNYYDNVGEYPVYMVATSPDGCIDTAFGKVTVVEGTTIPNAFSPNNDGFNDVFLIRNSNVSEYDLKIYNRWGVLVYKSTAPLIKWDGNTISGQPASGGTYFWVLNAKYASGAEYSGEKKGYVELVRN